MTEQSSFIHKLVIDATQELERSSNKYVKIVITELLGIKIDHWGEVKEFDPEAFKEIKDSPEIEIIRNNIKNEITKTLKTELKRDEESNFSINKIVTQITNKLTNQIQEELYEELYKEIYETYKEKYKKQILNEIYSNPEFKELGLKKL